MERSLEEKISGISGGRLTAQVGTMYPRLYDIPMSREDR